MFESKRNNPVIPGYTGYIPKNAEEQDGYVPKNRQPKSQIPGYCGFIPGVKAENMFGKTYGKATYISSSGTYAKGSEIPNEERYNSILQDSFVNLRKVEDRTVAELVGVPPKKTFYTEKGAVTMRTETYGKVFEIPPDEVEQHEETEDEAERKFYGDVDEKKVVKKGDPIPGFTGYNKRVNADNIFGATYAQARKKGQQSEDDIKVQQQFNIKAQGTMIPPINK